NNETPVQAMKKWQAEKPELFVKRVYNQAGLDNFADPRDRGAPPGNNCHGKKWDTTTWQSGAGFACAGISWPCPIAE
ncbi:hypothetical protein HDE71_005427, partial [Janthinobacterium sp. S3M3]|nr:hypothetical protein [Janthinobacterium sp. S3T4]MBB5616342.1 hypothetical protein [Janthinobacterium sp. S3M3]